MGQMLYLRQNSLKMLMPRAIQSAHFVISSNWERMDLWGFLVGLFEDLKKILAKTHLSHLWGIEKMPEKKYKQVDIWLIQNFRFRD